MRAPAILQTGAASFEELKPACQVLILHEDFSAYSRAVEVCRRVMERFASELDFDIKCWNFIELADPNCARHAAKTASTADIILMSVRTAPLPVEIERWLDSFFATRFQTDGVLALVINGPNGLPFGREELVARLDQLASRLGMDFLSLMSDEDAAAITLPRAAPVRAHSGTRPV
jgi:hypothetical protein